MAVIVLFLGLSGVMLIFSGIALWKDRLSSAKWFFVSAMMFALGALINS